MSDENKETTKETKQTPAAAEGGDAAAAAVKTAAAAEAKTKEAAEAKTEKTAKTEVDGGEGTHEKKRALLKESDDEIPDDAELLELTPAALKKRLGRATKRELKERFGTDNFDDIKAKMDKLTKLEAQEEERKRQSLSEIERERADKIAAEERATKAETRLQALLDQGVISQEESRVIQLADAAGMDAEYIEDQFPKLAKYLNENFSAKELKKQDKMDKEIKKWFSERLKAKPKLAKEPVSTSEEKPAVEEKPKPKVGFSNGAKNSAPPAKDGVEAATEKTFKPGQKNSMTRGESREEMRKMGIRY